MTRRTIFDQPYVRPLRELVTVKPGEVRHVTIYHDTGCPRLRGGLCTCEPDLEVLNRKQRRAHRKDRR